MKALRGGKYIPYPLFLYHFLNWLDCRSVIVSRKIKQYTKASNSPPQRSIKLHISLADRDAHVLAPAGIGPGSIRDSNICVRR